MSFCANISELYRELRTAAGTVLTTLGSRLEADARAQVDEVGPQWLTEFEEAREVLEPSECTCQPCPLRDEDVCDEAEAEDSGCDCLPCELGSPEGCTADAYFGEVPDSSAAVPDAADGAADHKAASPTSSGVEGLGEVSDILPSASPGCSGDDWDPAKEVAELREAFASIGIEMRDDEEIAQRFRDLADALHPEADPGEVTPQPSPGEQVSHEDLSAHIFAIRRERVLTSDDMASSLLADFNITRK